MLSGTADPGRYVLVIGGHRMEAARQLGWAEIEATVFDGTADEARLAEIDENLYRRELSPYDQAAFLAERQTICKRMGRLHGPHGDRKGPSARLALGKYEDELAAEFGISRRVLFRALRRRSNVHPGVWAMLARTPVAEKGAALDALVEVPSGKQEEVVRRYLQALDEGGKPNFAQLCRQARGQLPPKAPPSRARRAALAQAWRAADEQDREHFVRSLEGGDVAALQLMLIKVTSRREAA